MNLTSDNLTYDNWIAVGRANGASSSGDCARVVPQRPGRTLVFLGDVTGHDARAARLAADLDRHVSDLASFDPGRLLTTLNAVLEGTWPSDVFVSAICFAIDSVTGQGSIAVAGQLPPIMKGRSSSWPIAAASGPPLGIVAGHGYDESSFALLAGDLLVAFTDGVADPLGTGADFLGLSALAQLVDRACPSPDDLCASILAAASGIGISDDATVLAVASPIRDFAPSFGREARHGLAA